MRVQELVSDNTALTLAKLRLAIEREERAEAAKVRTQLILPTRR